MMFQDTDSDFYDVDGIRGHCPECNEYIHYWNPPEYPATTTCDGCGAIITVDIETTAETTDVHDMAVERVLRYNRRMLDDIEDMDVGRDATTQMMQQCAIETLRLAATMSCDGPDQESDTQSYDIDNPLYRSP